MKNVGSVGYFSKIAHPGTIEIDQERLSFNNIEDQQQIQQRIEKPVQNAKLQIKPIQSHNQNRDKAAEALGGPKGYLAVIMQYRSNRAHQHRSKDNEVLQNVEHAHAGAPCQIG